MFPYPSGNGLHVGHWRGYVLSDVWSRYRYYKIIMCFILWDGMLWTSAENDAIKGIHPRIGTEKMCALKTASW